MSCVQNVSVQQAPVNVNALLPQILQQQNEFQRQSFRQQTSLSATAKRISATISATNFKQSFRQQQAFQQQQGEFQRQSVLQQQAFQRRLIQLMGGGFVPSAASVADKELN